MAGIGVQHMATRTLPHRNIALDQSDLQLEVIKLRTLAREELIRKAIAFGKPLRREDVDAPPLPAQCASILQRERASRGERAKAVIRAPKANAYAASEFALRDFRLPLEQEKDFTIERLTLGQLLTRLDRKTCQHGYRTAQESPLAQYRQ